MTGTMRLFLDTILPGSEQLGLPAGSSVALPNLPDQAAADQQMTEMLHQIDTLARAEWGRDFTDLAAAERLACVERARKTQARLAAAVITHCLRGYYSDAAVLHAVSAGAVPPFPEGNPMEEDDWSILEPVFERGPIFRQVPS